MTQEQTVETPTQVALDRIVNDSGLQLNDAETIKQSYLPYFVQIAEIKEQAKKIDFENPKSIDEKIARDLRLKTVKIRTGSEAVKDERKKIHMLKANVEQSAWNLIKTTCQLDEEVFMQVEKKREIAEAKRKAELKQQRLIELQPYTQFISIEFINLGEMSDEAYGNLIEGARLQLQAKIDAEAKEIERKAAQQKAEDEERARINKENEALKAQEAARISKEKADKEVKDVRFEVRKAQMLKAGFTYHGSYFKTAYWSAYWEQVYRPDDDFWNDYTLDIEKARVEFVAKEAEIEKGRTRIQTLDKKIAEQKAAAEKWEQQQKRDAQEKTRLEAEAKEKEDREQQKARLAPDKTKLVEFAGAINTLQVSLLPESFTSDAARKIHSDAVALLGKVSKFIREKSENI